MMESRTAPNHISVASEQLTMMRHSTAHLMASAIQRLWPEAKFGVGPAISSGFYYDVDLPTSITPKDLEALEKMMRDLKKQRLPYERIEVPINEAVEEMRRRNQPYKVELLDLLRQKGSTAVAEATGDEDAVGAVSDGSSVVTVSLYKLGDFIDLCRGPHLTNTGEVGEFKLTGIAGAYWRGNAKNPQLQRIYGIVFASKEELKEYLQLLEEAKKRDHRRIGQELDLFCFSELVGSGLPLFTAKGTLIRRLVESFVQSLQEPHGYHRVQIPHITKIDLYKKSGHWEKFKNDLFHVSSKGGEEFCIKPMNCPHHIEIYAARQRSYRDLPIRLSEVTSVYRDELPGTLQGLSRVRMITQDDGHVFCTPEQVTEEALKIFSIINDFYKAFKMDLSVRLSLWDESKPEKYLGGPEIWNNAEEQLRQVLRMAEAKWVEEKGEAAFYGPKIDFIVKDVLQRSWQLATIQLDFNLPQRFDLHYVSPDGEHARPAMLHRAILGAVERFMAILIEHFAGAFPVWLSPVQAVLIPIADRHMDYVYDVRNRLSAFSTPENLGAIRVEIDDSRESMQKKIRNAQLQKVPYMLIVGDRELEQEGVSVRLRHGKDLGLVSISALIDRMSSEIKTRQDTTD